MWIQIKQSTYDFFKTATSTLSSNPLKLVNQFTYIDNNISSMESYAKTPLIKVWNAIDRLSIKWKCDYPIR